MAQRSERNSQTTLQAAGAQPRDVGKGTARIPYSVLEAMGLQEGAIVEITGKRTTANVVVQLLTLLGGRRAILQIHTRGMPSADDVSIEDVAKRQLREGIGLPLRNPEVGANFIGAKSSSLLSKRYGESERQISKLFKRARQVSPSIILIDEIDSLAPQRGAEIGDAAVTERVVNTLLVERTESYTGADLENLVRKAGLGALRAKLETSAVTMQFFEQALKDSHPSVTPEMQEDYRKIAAQLKQERPMTQRIGFAVGE